MTQYPSPYSPPPAGYGMSYGYGVPEDLLAPARRAGLLMIILGALTIVLGLCMGLCSVMLPQMMDQMPADQREMFDQMQQRIPFSLSTFLLVMAILMLAVGIVYIILGLFTRRGGMGIVITSIVLTTLVTLFLLISTVGSLVQPNGAVSACFTIVVLGLFILLLVWLIQAARAATKLPQLQAQYQAQYQQYLQTQQMYGQAGYGYGAQYPAQSPPPPQANPPTNPPTYPPQT